MQGDEFGMKIKKILTKVFVGCVLGTAVITNALSAAASDMVASTVIDFSDSSWNNFSGSGEVTQTDGTKVDITKNDRVNIGVKDSANAGFVTNLNGAEKYLQYDAATGSGTNVLTVTPKSALTEDFSFEFKAAGKKVTGSNVRYMSVVMIPEGSQNVAGTTVMGWKDGGYMYDTGTNGNGSRWPNNTTNLQLIIPNWGTTTKYSIGYSATDFRSYKVDVHFNNGNPTFDLWGFYATGTGLDEDEEGRQLLLKNVKFAEKDGNNTATVDYSKGFGSIRIEMGASTGDEGIALADMKINKIQSKMNFDFEADSYAAAFKQDVEQSDFVKNTVTWVNGMSLEMNSKAKVAVTSSGFVKNNPSGNKYMEVTATTTNSSTNNSNLTINFPQAMKEDFVTEYKFAIDAPYPTDSYNNYWAQNTNSVIVNAIPKTGGAAAGSRLFFVLGNDRYGEPTNLASNPEQTTYTSGTVIGTKRYVSGQAFETIRIVTKYSATLPTADVYRKAAGKDYWELVKKDINYSKYPWGNTANAINYADGISAMTIRLDSGHQSVESGKTIKYAIDDINVYPLGENETYVDTFELSKDSDNKYTANVKITNNTVSGVSYKLVLCAYDKDGKMLEAKTANLDAAAGVPASNTDLSITNNNAAYAKLYMIDSISGLGIKAQTIAY